MLEVINRGGCNSCKISMDVRFADGSLFSNQNLDFSHGNALAFDITEPAAYILVVLDTTSCATDVSRFRLTFRMNEQPMLRDTAHVSQTKLMPGSRLCVTQSIMMKRVHQASALQQEDIMIYTQLDAERLPRLVRLARSVNLPISASVFYDGSKEMEKYIRRYVDENHLDHSVSIHLARNAILDVPPAWARNPYPVQELRNIALQQANATWVIYVEADMVFPPDAAALLSVEAAALGRHTRWLSILPLYTKANSDTAPPDAAQLPMKKDLRAADLVPCQYDSHNFMDYMAWEQTHLEPATPLTFYWKEEHSMDMCSRVFIEGRPQCSFDDLLQEGADHGWVIEPYFIARKTEVPMFDPNIMYDQADKMDQLRLMASSGWVFAVNARVYLVDWFGKDGLSPLNLHHVSGEVRHFDLDSPDAPMRHATNEAYVMTLARTASVYYGWMHHLQWAQWTSGISMEGF